MRVRKPTVWICGALLLILPLALRLFLRADNGWGVPKITDGAVRVVDITLAKAGNKPRQIFWVNPNEIIVSAWDAPKIMPMRIRLSDGTRTPLFSTGNPVAASVIRYGVTAAFSPNGRYLLWQARDIKTGTKNVTTVLDLQTMDKTFHPQILTWNRAGGYNALFWMPDNRHFVEETSWGAVTLLDRTDVKQAVSLPKIIHGRWTDYDGIVGRKEGLVLYKDGKRHKLVYRDPLHPTSSPMEFPIPRRNLLPISLSPDHTRLLWFEKTGEGMLSLLFHFGTATPCAKPRGLGVRAQRI